MMNPIERFGRLFERAIRENVPEPTAMALATVGTGGRPSVRMVLLKGFDVRGFVFYTNLESRKAEELMANPWAALCFHWQPLEAQVRVEGGVTKVSEAEADEYFDGRPRGSQIGAWASRQSRPLSSTAELDQQVVEVESRFAGGRISRPPFWSGYLLSPDRIEFWTGKPSRLHDREVFTLDAATGAWSGQLLYP